MTTPFAPPPAWPAPVPLPANSRSRRGTLVALQAAYVLFLAVWFPLSIVATMGLANTAAWWATPALLWTWAYPLAVLVAVVVSHALLARHPRAARWWNLLPLPWMVAGGALLVWMFTA
jgi:hypothetical protein